MTGMLIGAGAVFSPCRTYRYRLDRFIGNDKGTVTGSVAFILLNPSTADEARNDPTIRRCIGYARAWGLTHLTVGNLFAIRATDPKVMRAAADPVGSENDLHLVEMARGSDFAVCAWGNHGAHRNRGNEVCDLLLSFGVKLYSLKVNEKTGTPSHPLYLSKALTMKPWRVR